MKYIKEFENKKPEKIIKYYDNGNIKSIVYILNGELHRKDGPAFQKWYSNGKNAAELYLINGKYHRENGPVIQMWHENGKKLSEFYYLNDNIYTREKWLKKLKEINSPHYKEQQMLYDIDKYNL